MAGDPISVGEFFGDCVIANYTDLRLAHSLLLRACRRAASMAPVRNSGHIMNAAEAPRRDTTVNNLAQQITQLAQSSSHQCRSHNLAFVQARCRAAENAPLVTASDHGGSQLTDARLWRHPGTA